MSELLELKRWVLDKLEDVKGFAANADAEAELRLEAEEQVLEEVLEEINSLLPLSFHDLEVGEFFQWKGAPGSVRFKTGENTCVCITQTDKFADCVGLVYEAPLQFQLDNIVIRLIAKFEEEGKC